MKTRAYFALLKLAVKIDLPSGLLKLLKDNKPSVSLIYLL